MRTPLFEQHRHLGARMTEFAGWEMPLYYSGIVSEVQAVRSTAGVFDLSHMGELFVTGPEALGLLQYIATNDVSALQVGQAQYTLMCADDGGVIDDLIIYRLDAKEYMLVVNAANTRSDFEWITQHERPGAKCEDRSAAMGIVAVQGPDSLSILQQLAQPDPGRLHRFSAEYARVGEVYCRIARTGYTGEDGFELYCAASDCEPLWDSIMDAGEAFGAKPAGLGARDILRLEAGYALYGHELTREHTPVDARLLWVVKLAKGDFLGRDAILRVIREGPRQLLVGLEAVDRCVPREGYDVVAGPTHIGHVTSGSFSPTLGKGIAMAYVDPACAEGGTPVQVRIREKACPCRVAALPFYRSERIGVRTASEEVTSAS